VNLFRDGCKMFILIAGSNLVNVHKFLRIFSALLCSSTVCTLVFFIFILFRCSWYTNLCAWTGEMWKLIVYMKQRMLVC